MQDNLGNTPVYEVGNVAEYMECIRRHHLEGCISRGEDRAYPHLSAAAFRRNSSLDIRKMVGAFERHIGNSLTEMQRKHFLAFSQHYGLPTNLLDFTFSPLISLYFSCGGEPGDNGYVYFIKKDRLIDISENLELINSVILSRFLFAPEELADLYRGITVLLVKEEADIFECLEEIDRLTGSCPGNESIQLELYKLRKNRNAYSIDQLDKLLASMKKRLKYLKGYQPEILSDGLGSYGRLFVRFLWILIFFVRHDGPFSVPFYFTYEPANITNRVSNQSSIFLYQLYGINEIRQEIQPDFRLKISNKTEILEELDCLGINEQFVFNDYDHIASYIKKKYLKLSDERAQTVLNLKRMSRPCLREEAEETDQQP